MKTQLIVFFLSILSALTLLIVERLVGIGWDYHQDSVTYAENSAVIIEGILSQGITAIPNSGYYFIAAFFGQNIYIITAYNILLFSLTNIYFAKLHWSFFKTYKESITFLLLFLLLNPYRIHLATTLLKDTTVIFLLTLTFYYFSKSKSIGLFIYFHLFIIRIASALYLFILIPLRYWKYLLLPIFILTYLYPDILIDRLDASNEVSLKNRDFDNMPTFQEYGYLGSLLRAILWPFFALTGSFVFLTPAPALMMVALGSYLNMLYTWKAARITPLVLYVYLPMSIFAILAPGFISYIRYVYPLVALSPLIALIHNKRFK